MKDFIIESYNNYKLFMDLKEDILPKLNPIIDEGKQDINSRTALAYINADEILNPTVNLYINPSLFTYKKNYQLSKLYHEFTHILDAVTLFNDFAYEKIIALLSTYSEFHASQIELAYNVGFKNIHSCRKMDLNKTFITYENSSIKIQDDYLYPMADALCIIDKDCNAYYDIDPVEYYSNYSIFESKSMYYLGKRKFCAKYSLVKIADITDKEYGQFSPYLKNIEKCIEQKDFNNLIRQKSNMFEKYTSYFKFNNLDLLMGELKLAKIQEHQNKSSQICCPCCQSINLLKIQSVSNRTIFKIFSVKKHKTFHCNNCGYEW